MIRHSIHPMSSNISNSTITWNGFSNSELEYHFQRFKIQLLKRLFVCISLCGILYTVLQILLIIIRDSDRPPMPLLTIMSICGIIFGGIHLSMFIPEILEDFNKWILAGIVFAVAVEIYMFNEIYQSNDFNLCWTLLLTFLVFSCIPASLKFRMLVSVFTFLPNCYFIRDYSVHDALNKAVQAKVISFLLYAIPVLALGCSMHIQTDMEFRSIFEKRRQLKAKHRAEWKYLVGQEQLLLSRLSSSIGSEVLLDIRSENVIKNNKMYSHKYTNVSIMVVRFTDVSAFNKETDDMSISIINRMFTEIEVLSQIYHQEIISVFQDGMVLISEEHTMNKDTVHQTMVMSLKTIHKLKSICHTHSSDVTVKIGIHKGDLLVVLHGQQAMQLFAFGKYLKITSAMAEFGNKWTVNCSQSIKTSTEHYFNFKENKIPEIQDFPFMNGINIYEVTTNVNEIQHYSDTHSNTQPYYYDISQYRHSSSRKKKHNHENGQRKCSCRKYRGNLGSSMMSHMCVPLVLLCQLSLVIVHQSLTDYTIGLFSVTIVFLVVILCYLILKTRQQTKLQMFRIMTFSFPQNTRFLVFCIMSVVALMACNVSSKIGKNEQITSILTNSTSSDLLLYYHMNDSVLSLLAVATLLRSTLIKYGCIVGCTTFYWINDCLLFKSLRLSDVIYSLLNISAIAVCLLYLEITVQKVMTQTDKARMLLEDENKDIDDLSDKINLFLSNMTPIQLLQQNPRELQDGALYQSYQNISVMVATFPNIMDNLLNISDTKIVQLLTDIISQFDQLLLDQTFGNLSQVVSGQMEYTVLSGLQKKINKEVHIDDVETLLRFAIGIRDINIEVLASNSHSLSLHIGIHCGPATILLVGFNRRHFICGPAYSTSRNLAIESKGREIAVSKRCKNILVQKGYKFYNSGRVFHEDGDMVMIFCLGRKQRN